MRTRTLVWIGTALIAAAVVLSVGTAVAMGRGSTMPWGSNGMMGATPISGSGMGGMMGSDGHGGMMGGTQQTPVASPVTGVTKVTIENFAYSPSNLQVSAGTTVTWTNAESAPHSVTFKNGMRDSGLLRQGQSFTYTFTTPGTFDYYCTAHPYMLARVIVTA